MLQLEKLIYKNLIISLINNNLSEDEQLEVIDSWLIKFGYKKEDKFIDKILYVCKDIPKIPLGEGIDIFVLGKNELTSLRGKKYIHWFKDDFVQLSDEELIRFDSTLFNR